MSEFAHFTEFNPASEPKRVGEKLSLVASHIRNEKPQTLPEEIRSFLVDALLFLKIEKAEEVVGRLERSILEGNHDMVNDFLNDIAKMRYSEFAQELLKHAGPRRFGPGIVLNRNLSKVGRQVIGLSGV